MGHFEAQITRKVLQVARLLRTHSNSAPWGYDYATQYYRKLTVSLPRFLSQPAMVGTLEEKADATAEQTRRAAIVHVAEEHPCHSDLLYIVEQIETTFVPKEIHGERYPITFNFSTHHGPLHVDCPDSDGPGTHIVVYCLRYPTRHNGIPQSTYCYYIHFSAALGFCSSQTMPLIQTIPSGYVVVVLVVVLIIVLVTGPNYPITRFAPAWPTVSMENCAWSTPTECTSTYQKVTHVNFIVVQHPYQYTQTLRR